MVDLRWSLSAINIVFINIHLLIFTRLFPQPILSLEDIEGCR